MPPDAARRPAKLVRHASRFSPVRGGPDERRTSRRHARPAARARPALTTTPSNRRAEPPPPTTCHEPEQPRDRRQPTAPTRCRAPTHTPRQAASDIRPVRQTRAGRKIDPGPHPLTSLGRTYAPCPPSRPPKSPPPRRGAHADRISPLSGPRRSGGSPPHGSTPEATPRAVSHRSQSNGPAPRLEHSLHTGAMSQRTFTNVCACACARSNVNTPIPPLRPPPSPYGRAPRGTP